MIIIVCVDNALGTMFNNTRQSQDSILRKRVVELSKKSKLWMTHYSQSQFSQEDARHLNYVADPITEAISDEYAFIEGLPIRWAERWIEKIILYRWNEEYPSDQKLDIDLSQWHLESTTDFIGSSHTKITEEVYRK